VTAVTRIRRVSGGLQLLQNGTVLSELRHQPGPTHSVFDVLAVLVQILAPPGPVGILGFGAGSIVAPLRYLGFLRPLAAVDLDPVGHQLFTRHCAAWSGTVSWEEADALRWLQRQRTPFAALVEDLSVPIGDDVFKPAALACLLPAQVRSRLLPSGVAVFNLVPDPDGRLPGMEEIRRNFDAVRIVSYEGFVNATVIAGTSLPSAQVLGRRLHSGLRQLGSERAGAVRVSARAPDGINPR